MWSGGRRWAATGTPGNRASFLNLGVARSRHAVDYIVGANLGVLRRAIPGFRLLEVALTHAEICDPGETARTFGCPVRFGQPQNVLWFPESMLDSVPAAANPAIAEQIETHASSLLAEITSGNVRERTADAIRAQLEAGLPADRLAVARLLHVSERTLQRQLEQKSTSFKALRDSLRSDLARALLSDGALKIEAIAESVGFVEVASFCRAFARWSGCSPTGYRERLARPIRLHSRQRVAGRLAGAAGRRSPR